MIQLRTVLASIANPDGTEDWVVQEADGKLSHEFRPLDRPAEVADLEKSPECATIRELLYSEKATPEEKSLALPVALALSKGEAVKTEDVAAVEDAKQAADTRKAEADQAEVAAAEGEVKP